MVKSPFLQAILDKLIAGNECEPLLREQLQLMEERHYEYSGSGFFVGFSYSESIDRHLLPDTSVHAMIGVVIKSPELNKDGAEAILHLAGGKISYLEIVSFYGPYPKQELTDYTISYFYPNMLTVHSDT